jgi:hypothetical protein
MVAQVAVMGFRASVVRRLQCFSLFGHALDIIWVALFSVVYLTGVVRRAKHSTMRRRGGASPCPGGRRTGSSRPASFSP